MSDDPIRAALLDARGVYQRIDTLASAADLTPLHLPQITGCDLPAGEYVWIPADNQFGGAFWPLAWLRRQAANIAQGGPQDTASSALVEYLRARGLEA